jgi:hypothetical protein
VKLEFTKNIHLFGSFLKLFSQQLILIEHSVIRISEQRSFELLVLFLFEIDAGDLVNIFFLPKIYTLKLIFSLLTATFKINSVIKFSVRV